MGNGVNEESNDSFGCSFQLLICALVSIMVLYKPIGNIDLLIMLGNVKHLYQYPLLILALFVQVIGVSFVIFLFSAVVNWGIQFFGMGEKITFIVSVLIVSVLFYLITHSDGVSREYDYVDYMMDRVR